MARRALLNLAGLLALITAGIASADGPLPYHMFLPMVTRHVEPVRGTAACSARIAELGAGGTFCFAYWPGWLAVETTPERVPLASTRQMAEAGYTDPLTVTHPGQWWMLFNEPDNSDPQAGDGLTPQQGAIRFKVMSDSIHSQGGKVVCCNTLFGTGWLDATDDVYRTLYGGDMLGKIDGISFHNYGVLLNPPNCTSDACILVNWTARATAWVTWRNAHAGAYPTRSLPLWLTEMGWSPCCEMDGATAIRHMNMLCAQPILKQMARVAWFIGQHVAGLETISLFNSDGNVSALGAEWSRC